MYTSLVYTVIASWAQDAHCRFLVVICGEIFLSVSPGYRHVYLEGLTEASIFVHIIINETYGKVGTAGNFHFLLTRMDLNVPQNLPGFVLECPGGSECVGGVSLQEISKETPPYHGSTPAVHTLADVLTVST